MSTLSISTLEMGPDEPRHTEIINVNNELLITNGHDQTPEKELEESMLEMELTNGIKEPNFPPIHQESSHINNIEPIETNGFIGNGDNLGFNIDNTKEDIINLNNDDFNNDNNEDNEIHLSDNCLKYSSTLKMNNKIDLFNKNSDINHNGDIKKLLIDNDNCIEEDSDNDKSESKSETTLCASPKVVAACRNAKSNETSTDTLVAENGIISG